MALISKVKTLSFRVSQGGDLTLVSHVKIAFKDSGEGNLALISHIKILAFRVTGSDVRFEDFSLRSLLRKRPGSDISRQESRFRVSGVGSGSDLSCQYSSLQSLLRRRPGSDHSCKDSCPQSLWIRRPSFEL